jgi:hypothetical protein
VRDEEVVQTAAAGEAHLVGGVEHAGRAFEERARVVHGDGLHELLGAQAAPALEELLAVRGAEPQVLGQTVERRLLGPGLGQEGDGAADEVVVARTIGRKGGGGSRGDRCLEHGCLSRLLAAMTPDLVCAIGRIDPFLVPIA